MHTLRRSRPVGRGNRRGIRWLEVIFLGQGGLDEEAERAALALNRSDLDTTTHELADLTTDTEESVNERWSGCFSLDSS